MKWYDWVAVGLWVLGVCVYARILYQDRMRTGERNGEREQGGSDPSGKNCPRRLQPLSLSD